MAAFIYSLGLLIVENKKKCRVVEVTKSYPNNAKPNVLVEVFLSFIKQILLPHEFIC
jgi:hypothetical protein